MGYEKTFLVIVCCLLDMLEALKIKHAGKDEMDDYYADEGEIVEFIIRMKGEQEW
jgi:hypothetical protein